MDLPAWYFSLMDLPAWYFNLTIGILIVAAILSYGTD